MIDDSSIFALLDVEHIICNPLRQGVKLGGCANKTLIAMLTRRGRDRASQLMKSHRKV